MMPERGWEAVTVPGAVSAWIALWRKFGKLPLAVIAEPAIRYAREGYPVSPAVARLWANAEKLLAGQRASPRTFLPQGRALVAGELFRSEAMARSLEQIADTEGEAFYRGALAEAMVAHAKAHGGAMTLDDLGAHQADFVETLSQPSVTAWCMNCRPNGQGIATLITIGILEALGADTSNPDSVDTIHLAIEATKLALADLFQYVPIRPPCISTRPPCWTRPIWPSAPS